MEKPSLSEKCPICNHSVSWCDCTVNCGRIVCSKCNTEFLIGEEGEDLYGKSVMWNNRTHKDMFLDHSKDLFCVINMTDKEMCDRFGALSEHEIDKIRFVLDYIYE